MNHEFHPCPKPIFLTAEQAAAERAAQHEACEREAAAARERAAEEARVAEALAAELAAAEEAAAVAGPGEAPQGAAPGGFGRGWIPLERDIGLPSDESGEGGDTPFAVAPAQAGAHPEVAADADPGSMDQGRDGPLPAQGRRGDVADGGERIWRSIDFTPARRAVFLHHLAQDGNVRTACSRVPISAQAAYLARRRCAVFRAGWDAALVHSREHALQVLANRALDGIREEVWHRGEKVGERVRHDARLLLAHLGRLDARCKDPRAQARAERFDELLALVAGEDYAWTLRDEADAGRTGRDEILPVARDHHSNRAAALADGGCDPDDEADAALDQDEIVAREAAEAEWDEWAERVDAVNDALEAGEEPVVQPGPAEAEPPFEVKSLGGIAPRAFARGAAEFSARTLSRSSTWSAASLPRRGVSAGAGATVRDLGGGSPPEAPACAAAQ